MRYMKLERLSREPLAARSTTTTDYVAATNRGHARAKAMATLADNFRRLISAFHVRTPNPVKFSASL
jgi:hypothetical protein